MKKKSKIAFPILLAVLAFILFSCSEDDAPVVPPTTETPPTQTIVELAVASDALTQLEAAVIKADLAGTLSGTGPFTVFAPTDAAFTALLEALGSNYTSIDDFDTDAEIALLKNILLYHVIPSEVKAGDLAAGQVETAFANNPISVIGSGNSFVIGDASETDAKITSTDIAATNGVVHLIDKVLLPQAALDFVAGLKDIVGIASSNEDFSVLVAAVVKTDLVETLKSEGPFTVFAPTNDAFVALLDALGSGYNSLDDFDTAEEIALLKNILLYHVVPAQVKSTDLVAGEVGTAYVDNSIAIIANADTFVIGDASDTNANITAIDFEATNGVVHVVDKVLLPQAAIDFVNTLHN